MLLSLAAVATLVQLLSRTSFSHPPVALALA